MDDNYIRKITFRPFSINALSVLGIIMVTLKLLELIDISWWWVTLPFWWYIPIFLLIMILKAIVIIFFPPKY